MECQELNASNVDGTFLKGHSTSENSLAAVGQEKQQNDSHHVDPEGTSDNSRNQASTHLAVNTESDVYHENNRNTDRNGTAALDVKYRNLFLKRFKHIKRLTGENQPHVLFSAENMRFDSIFCLFRICFGTP
ncbi:hypothetical protein DPMN_164285 [Dreissena polymorpha]|uniref:Uncharacterized protein n=1 Tax=Dreissena polymorpha TaxID=45954 RepID=A0A9D4EYE4_DREPO|nr:hypothetical protein DPMN_164285 [Dreissena polymorpha]